MGPNLPSVEEGMGVGKREEEGPVGMVTVIQTRVDEDTLQGTI